MLELEAMGIERVKVETAVQYVDHNLVQADHMNADEHLFLRSACRRFGVWYSRPGNGISHPVHMQRFGKPGTLLVGSDSHTPAAGSLGMLAFGAGGLEVALAMAGEPLHIRMPQIWGVRLGGRLPEWVSAKDVILEMLRRHGVEGGFAKIVEYYGPGLDYLSAMDRHVIANMGAELGATTSIFPSDEATRRFMRDEEREGDWVEILSACRSYRACIGKNLHTIHFAILIAHETARCLVGERCWCRSKLRAHVRDHMAVHGAQRVETRA